VSVLRPALDGMSGARRRRGPPEQRSERHKTSGCKPEPVTCGYARREGFEPPNRQIRSLVLRVDLVGSRPIWPAHVGWLVGLVGSRPVPSDRLDDQTDDQARQTQRADPVWSSMTSVKPRTEVARRAVGRGGARRRQPRVACAVPTPAAGRRPGPLRPCAVLSGQAGPDSGLPVGQVVADYTRVSAVQVAGRAGDGRASEPQYPGVSTSPGLFAEEARWSLGAGWVVTIPYR
jgi:hypothetical protein